MLRTAVLVLGLLILGAGLLLLAVRPAAAPPALVFGGLLTLGTVFERWRYKWTVSSREARGQATGERFVDTKTGALIEVYYDPATGERSYVELKGGKPQD